MKRFMAIAFGMLFILGFAGFVFADIGPMKPAPATLMTTKCELCIPADKVMMTAAATEKMIAIATHEMIAALRAPDLKIFKDGSGGTAPAPAYFNDTGTTGTATAMIAAGDIITTAPIQAAKMNNTSVGYLVAATGKTGGATYLVSDLVSAAYTASQT